MTQPTPLERIQALRPDEVQYLPPQADQEACVHQWSQPEIDAITLALASRRPLLLRGEPGTGKTQLARAAAQWLGWRLHAVTIHPRFEASDLLYRFDAVKRLADAQAGEKITDETSYWQPGPLWRVFGWASAQRYGCPPGVAARQAEPEPPGHVLLLDEIDKADSDLPNSLLEVLGQRSFRIEPLDLAIGDPGRPQPLLMITSNEERELPAAFVRRCVVLNLDAPGDYLDWLTRRGIAHYGADSPRWQPEETACPMHPDVIDMAARQLQADREAALDAGLSPPGLAEFLDLLAALQTLAAGDQDAQTGWLRRLSGYAFIKHPPQPGYQDYRQGRPGVPPAATPAAD